MMGGKEFGWEGGFWRGLGIDGYFGTESLIFFYF